MNQTNNESKKWVPVIGLLLLLSLATAWGLGFFERDPVAKAQADFQELMDGDSELQEVSQVLDEDKIKALGLPAGAKVKVLKAGKDLESNLKQMSDEQRKEFAMGMIPQAMENGRREMQRVLDLPPDERRKAIDEMIDQQMEMRKKGGLVDRLQQGETTADISVETTDDGNGVQIEQSITIDGSSPEGQRQMLDMTSPEVRATMDEFQKLMKERMEERGMDTDQAGIPLVLSFGSSDEVVVEE